MSYSIKGELIQMEKQARAITDRFQVRQFVIKTADKYPQEIKFQLTNDRCDILDRFQKGQEINVEFDLKGNRSKEGKVFNNLEAWRITGVDPLPAPAPQMSRTAEPISEGISAIAQDIDDDLPF